MKIVPCRPAACALTALVALAAGAARSATFSLVPSADAMVVSSHAANNYGGAGAFAVAAPGLPKGEFQSLLQFELSAAKASFDAAFGAGNWTLFSAALQLTADNPNNALFNASAAGQISASWLHNDGWTEGMGTPNAPGAAGVTWDSLQALVSPAADEPLGSFSFSGATSGTADYALTPSPGLRTDLGAGALLSVRLYASPGETSVAGVFNSRSFMNPASRPQLVLTAEAIPEPASLALALCGGAFIVALRAAERRSFTGSN